MHISAFLFGLLITSGAESIGSRLLLEPIMTNASSLTPPSTTDSNGVKKRRSRVEKLVVWLLIAALGCVAAWEGSQRWGYNQTLSQLQSRIQQGDKADSHDLTLGEARLLVHGWPVETIAPRNLGKDVELKWRSLFKEFRIQIQLGQQDLVLSLRASGDPEEPSEPVPSIEPLVSASMLKAHYLTELPYRQIGNAGLSQSDTPMLLLDTSEPRYAPNVSSQVERGVLVRELGRQALIIAASEELGFELPPPHRPVFAPELMRAFHLVLRGNKEREEGNIEFAQRLYETALQASPNYTTAIFQRARLANTQQRWKDAVVDYHHLLKLLPGDAICHLLRGRVFEIQGDHAAAIADYEAALRTDPRNGSAHNNLTFLYSACIDPKYRDAAKAIEHAKALQTCDDQPKWSRQAALGVAHGALGEFHEAFSQTAASLQKAPSEWQERLSQRRDLFQKRQPYTRSGEWWR